MALHTRLATLLLSALVVAACSGAAATDEASGGVPPSATTVAGPQASAMVGPQASSAPLVPPTFEGGLTGETLAATGSEPAPAPPLMGLLDPDGSPFDLAEYAGSPTLLFFGYTNCPDVCPTTIGELFGVFEEAPEVEAVFISVDPERDTPEHLREWTAYMPDSFHAVTGDPGAIRRAADGFGVKYARVETTSTAGYTMSHTADVYLIDGAGRLVRSYPFGTPAATMVADISALETG